MEKLEPRRATSAVDKTDWEWHWQHQSWRSNKHADFREKIITVDQIYALIALCNLVKQVNEWNATLYFYLLYG